MRLRTCLQCPVVIQNFDGGTFVLLFLEYEVQPLEATMWDCGRNKEQGTRNKVELKLHNYMRRYSSFRIDHLVGTARYNMHHDPLVPCTLRAQASNPFRETGRPL
jgi:hypothetical protein